MNKAYLEKVMKRAGLCQEGREALLQTAEILDETTVCLMDEALDAYRGDTFFDYKGYLEKIAQSAREHLYGAHLIFSFMLTEHTEVLYRQKGWCDKWFDNMLLDLVTKTKECLDYHGVWGTFVAKWFSRWFTLERVALTRLQFELRKLGRDCTAWGTALTADTLVINVHIPAIGPLDHGQCEKDYKEAMEIFGDAFEGEVYFMCHSWLLHPDHPAFLPPTSRLLSFQKDYEIIAFDEDKEGKLLWRLFGVAYDGNPEHLTERNSLERAYKARMLSGGSIGEGFGIMIKK